MASVWKKLSLLILLSIIWQTNILALDVYVDGNLKGQVRYTPEVGKVEALKLFKVNASIEGENTPAKLVAIFGGQGDDFTWSSLNSDFPMFDFLLKRVTLTTNAPLYYGGEQALMSLGDLTVNYSPFIVRMDDQFKNIAGEYTNPMYKGIGIADLQLPLFPDSTFKVDGFTLWDRNSGAERAPTAIGLGTRLNLAFAGNEYAFTTVQRFDEKTEDRIALREKAILFEVTQNTPLGKLEFNWGENEAEKLANQLVERKKGAFTLITLSTPILPGISTKVTYSQLSPDFEPTYRDQTPRFNREGKFIGWNPLDAMRHIPGFIKADELKQDSLKWQFNVEAQKANLKLELERRQLVGADKDPAGTFGQFAWNWQEKSNQYLFGASGRLQNLALNNKDMVLSQQGRQIRFELKREMQENKLSGTTLSYRWGYEGLYPELLLVQQRVRLEKVFFDGPLKGVQLFSGLAHNRPLRYSTATKQLIKQLGFNYLNENGFEIEACWSTPNQEENPATLYDPEGLTYLGYDNIFRVGINLAF
jgi:hypothetical protein